MLRRRLWLLAVLAPLLIPSGASAHPGAWASHSTLQGGGKPDARTFKGCERAQRGRPWGAHRCKHKAYWNRKYRELPDGARRWLAITGGCETRGYPRYFTSYRVDTGNGFWGRYQFSPRTAFSAGFTMYVPHVYFREQDVRAWRWRLRTSAGQWPRCAAW